MPIPGSPSASATAATTGTARSAETVRTPSTAWRRPTSVTAATSVKSTASPSSATASPGASGLRSTATTRRPSSFARRIARRWWRPAPTKRTVLTSRAMRIRVPRNRCRRPARSDPTGATTHAFARSKLERTFRPRKSPSSTATSGLEPGISLQRLGGRHLAERVLDGRQRRARLLRVRMVAAGRLAPELPRDRVAVGPGRPESQLQVDRRVAGVFGLVAAAACRREHEHRQGGERRCSLPHADEAPNPGKRKLTRLERAIWQPFVAEKMTQTLRPLNSPVTSACCGPPY